MTIQLPTTPATHIKQYCKAEQTGAQFRAALNLRMKADVLLWITVKLSAACRTKLEAGEIIHGFRNTTLKVITILTACSHISGNKADFQ